MTKLSGLLAQRQVTRRVGGAEMDAALQRALGHPRRAELLSHLTHETKEATDKQLAEALDMAPSLVRYHLLVLSRAEAVVLVSGAPGEKQSYMASAGL